MSAAGGTSPEQACGGGAGTILVHSSSEHSLLIDSENANRDDDTYTPLPVEDDLESIDVSITHNSHVKLVDESAGFRVRSLWLDGTSVMTGDTLTLSAENASLQGDVESVSQAQLIVSSKN